MVNQSVPLIHPLVDLEGVLRLSYQKPADGSSLRFDNGSRIATEDIIEHGTYPMPTDNLGSNIKIELDRFGANAFSVQPYTGQMPTSVDVTIYTVKNPTD